MLNGIALRIINRHAALPRPRPSAPACHALGSGRVIQAKPPSANRQVGETTVSLRGDNMLPRGKSIPVARDLYPSDGTRACGCGSESGFRCRLCPVLWHADQAPRRYGAAGGRESWS